MAKDIPPDAISIHNDMVYHLNKNITPEQLEELKYLLNGCPLSANDRNQIKSIQKLFECLQNEKFISVGEYEKFVQKLMLVNSNLCSNVDTCTRKIKSLRKEEDIERMVISMDKAEYRASEGSTAFIMCSVDPKADSITWNKGHKCPPSTRIPIDNRKYFSGSREAPTLVINEATKAIDDAHYQCSAKANSTTVDGKIVHLEVYSGDDYGQPPSSKSSSGARGSLPLKNTDPTAEMHSQYIGTQENLIAECGDETASKSPGDTAEFGISNDQGCQASFVIKNKTDPKRPELVSGISNGFAVTTNASERVKGITCKPKCILVCIDITPARSPVEPSSVHLAKQFMHYILDGGRIQLSDESRTILDIDEATFEITPHNARQDGRPCVNISHGMFTVPVGGSAILQTYMYLIAPPAATSIQWFKMKSNQKMAIEIDNKKYFGGSDLSPTLIIRNATIDDQGQYLCWAKNEFGTGSSNTSFISIQSAVTLKTPKMIRLECKTGEEPRSKDSMFTTLTKLEFDLKTLVKQGRIKTEGSPSDISDYSTNIAIGIQNEMVHYLDENITAEQLSKLKYLFNGCPLSANDMTEIKSIQELFNRLQIEKNISVGDYTKFVPKLKLVNRDLCSSVDTCTRKIKSLRREEDKERMVILMDKAEYRVREGSPAFIECTVDPKPDRITWYKGNKGKPGTRIRIDHRKYFSGSRDAPCLVINNATKAKDEAHYQCIAKANSTVVEGEIVHLEVYSGDDYGQPSSSKSSSSARGSPHLKNTEPTAEMHSQYIGTQDSRAVDSYLKLFEGHVEIYRHVRVVFTGKEGAGKTTVCKRVQKRHVDLNLREPTVGAVLYPYWFLIDWKSKEWRRNDDKSAREVVEIHMGVTMKKAQTTEKASLQTEIRDGAGDLSITSSQNPAANLQQLQEITAVQQASKYANMDDALLSLWDMGGHSSFQASHNVFISSHGVYLLVFRLTDFLKDKLETDRLKKWIRMIGTFSSVEFNAPKLKEHEPPLIFVGTFLDKLRKSSTDFKGQVQKIQSSISKFPELSSHKFVRFCALDNSQGTEPDELRLLYDARSGLHNPPPPLATDDADANLEQLRGTIIELAEHQDQWGRKLPTRWLKLEMDLLKARESGTKILTLAKVIEMNKESIAPLADDDEIVLALEYLHCTRSVIYFREFDHVINDPQWLADCFSLLITDEQFLPKDDIVLSRDLELYKTKGELTQKLVDSFLCLDQNKAFLPHKSIILALMEKFGLLVRILISAPNTADVRYSEAYTIPSKLMELKKINGITDDVNDLKQRKLAVSQTLCFIFDDVFVPEELFHRIFATVMKTYRTASLSARRIEDEPGRDPVKTKDTTCLFRGFGCFEVNDLCRMILSMHWERSTVAATLFSPSESKLPPDSGPLVKQTLEGILQETLQMSNQQHFQYTHKLHCNFHLNPYDTPVELHSVFHAEEGTFCKGEECRRKHRLQKSDLLFWGIKKVTNRRVQGFVSSDAANCLDRRPTPQELSRLSYMVEVSKCQQLFIALGLSLPDISNTEYEGRSLAAVTQITRMFLKWTYAYPNQTCRHIERAMSEVEMATDDLGMTLETGWECANLDGLDSNEEVLEKQLVVSKIRGLVDNIGKNYFNLFLELGLTVSAIEKCEMDHIGAERRVEALIKLWINTFRGQATVIRIVKAMQLCRMDWHATAMAYCVANEEEKEEWSWWPCAIL